MIIKCGLYVTQCLYNQSVELEVGVETGKGSLGRNIGFLFYLKIFNSTSSLQLLVLII